MQPEKKPRKLHVRVDQSCYWDYIAEHGGRQTLEDMAAALNVSISTAKRQLDGLVFQKRLGVTKFDRQALDTYYIPAQKK